jgi:ABC-type lipoprotein release transport system permease subunit
MFDAASRRGHRMTFTRLLLLNLLSHWRSNLPVLLGVAVGTAVLTGALLVGDSLRGSLQNQALDQLGWVDQALVANRFVREDLATHLPADRVAPALLLQISAVTPEGAGARHRANQVTLLAVDERFWPTGRVPAGDSFWRGPNAGVVLNQAVADRLHVKVGDRINLLLQTVEDRPREALLGNRQNKDVLAEALEVKVEAILPDTGMARFTLRPGPSVPLNAFVPLRLLQERHDPPKLKGRINALFVGGVKGPLQEALAGHLDLSDWNLNLRTPEDRGWEWARLLAENRKLENPQDTIRKTNWKQWVPAELARQASPTKELSVQQTIGYVRAEHGYISLEGRQGFVEPVVVTAVEKTAAKLGWRASPALVYIADSIAVGKQQTHYAVVAALDPRLPPPLGPIQPLDQPPLKANQILLADWPGSPLGLPAGTKLTVFYYVPDALGQLVKRKVELELAGHVPLRGPADDRDIVPHFEGITDQLELEGWKVPFPYDPKLRTQADIEYWRRYRTAPKAYVTLETGQRLWGSRFGNVTSIRLVPPTAGDFPKAAADFGKALLAELPPRAAGLVFDDVKQRALAAGAGGTDFGTLFLGFSSFLILAALLLVGLLFRLSLDQRAREIGLLLAVGWRNRAVRRLVLLEGVILAVLGGLLGVAGAIGYARLLLDYLRHEWPGGLEHALLQLHVNPVSCAIGYGGSLLVSVLTLVWATRTLARVSPRALLQGVTVPETPAGVGKGPTASKWVAALAALAAANCLAFGMVAQDHELQAGCFFGGGMLVLTALLAGLWVVQHLTGRRSAERMPGLIRLGFRNAARHPVRSLLTVGLLAAAAFLVVAVEVFHRDPGADFLQFTGGSGGFGWVGESTTPVYADPGTARGRADLGFPKGSDDLLKDVTIVPFRLRAGDDASCLNLYQPRQPRLLGVPGMLIDRGGFHFADSEATTAEEQANPWLLLRQTRTDGAIPAIGELNSVKYILGSGLGKEIEVNDEQGRPVRLRFVALLQDSVFQSEVLVADSRFLQVFPRQEGFQFFLSDAPPDKVRVRSLLEGALADYGFSMTPSKDRLQAYLDVENTYLATFQALGGLGLLLGTLGLAVVLVRTVWERRGELALLRALGFRRSALGILLLAENLWLLLLGLAGGTLAALVAVAPYLGTQGGSVSPVRLAVLLGLVVVLGLASGAGAMVATLRAPLLPALRRD